MAAVVSRHLCYSSFVYFSTLVPSTDWLTFLLYFWFEFSPKREKIQTDKLIIIPAWAELLFISGHLPGGMESHEILSPVALAQAGVLGHTKSV